MSASKTSLSRGTAPVFGVKALLSLCAVAIVSAAGINEDAKRSALAARGLQEHSKISFALPSGVAEYESLNQLSGRLPAVQAQLPGPESFPGQYEEALDIEMPSDAAIHARDGSMKVMIVGDSMTQGKEGDWTWRYRIWDWFRSQNVAVDFVGPYKGTRQPPDVSAPMPPPLASEGKKRDNDTLIVDGGYAFGSDASFDSDHFAVWGRAAAEDVGSIQGMVSKYQPDLMLLMLGFNDLGWFYSDDKGLLKNIHTLITNARAGNPNLKIAMTNVPQRTSLGREDLPRLTDSYNKLLSDAIPGWSSDQSPIKEVLLRENYNCELSGCPAGYDGLHPNSMGEYQIANAFSQTLVNDFKIGQAVLAIPGSAPARLVPVPSNFKVFTSAQGVTATWDAVYGAYGYNTRSRIQGQDWAVGTVPFARYDAHWPLDGVTYDIQVQTSCGENCAGDWTSVGSAVAKPQTPTPPQNAQVHATSNGIAVTWDAPKTTNGGIIEYNIIYFDQDHPCAYLDSAAVTNSPGQVDGLVTGHRYFVAVDAWNSNGEGFPTILSDVVIGSGAPNTPGGVSVKAIDASTAHITWDESGGAGGYRVWTRNVNNASDVSNRENTTLHTPCSDHAWLFPGIDNFEFCVEAYNGDDVSGKDNCVRAPSYTSGSAPVATCAPPKGLQTTGCTFGATPTFTDDPDQPPTSPPPPPPTLSSTVGHQHSPTASPTPPSSHCDTRYGTMHWSGDFWDAEHKCGKKSTTDLSKCYPSEEKARSILWDQFDAAFEKLCLDVSCEGKMDIKFPGDGCNSKSKGPNTAYTLTLDAEYTHGDRAGVKEAYMNVLKTLHKESYSCSMNSDPGTDTVIIEIPTDMNIVRDTGSDGGSVSGLRSTMHINLAKTGPSACDTIKALWGAAGGSIPGGSVFGSVLAGTCK